jgi:hypothetical protein
VRGGEVDVLLVWVKTDLRGGEVDEPRELLDLGGTQVFLLLEAPLELVYLRRTPCKKRRLSYNDRKVTNKLRDKKFEKNICDNLT